jgi:hypothetical protein
MKRNWWSVDLVTPLQIGSYTIEFNPSETWSLQKLYSIEDTFLNIIDKLYEEYWAWVVKDDRKNRDPVQFEKEREKVRLRLSQTK